MAGGKKCFKSNVNRDPCWLLRFADEYDLLVSHSYCSGTHMKTEKKHLAV